MTKHERIIKYIKDLKVGTKISVRKIAQEIEVSEGTAYRAIKEAENLGYVNTIPRVGTVRIEKIEKKEIEKITFAEVVNIVDGTILGGRNGLHKTLNKFLIGAMEIENMKQYIEPGSLLIVGNRAEAHTAALENGAAVLISGGFGASEEVIRLANEMELPVMSSSYDTFTIATMINKALFMNMIKKEIILVEDVMVSDPFYLMNTNTVEDFRKMVKKTGHGRFPIIDSNKKVVGIATVKDIEGVSKEISINQVMIKEPITLTKKASVAYAAHIMVWEGIELIPVVQNNKKLEGVVTRRDVIKAFHQMQNQPHVGETIEDMIISNFSEEVLPDGSIRLTGRAVPAMLNLLGTVSCGAFVTIMAAAGFRIIKKSRRLDTVSDNLVVYFTKPLQLEENIEVIARIIDHGRINVKVDIEVYSNGIIAAKGLMSAKVLEK